MKGRTKASSSKNVPQKSNDEPIAKKKQRLQCELPIPRIPEKVGTLYVCGQNDMGQLGLGEDEMERKRPFPNTSIKHIVDICAGGMHSICLTKNGDVYSFGCNDEGALGRQTSGEEEAFIPKKINLPGKCVKISAGDSHTACLLEDGRVFACGSFRDSHGSMGLTLEGNKVLPIEVLPEIKSCDIASGADHLIILTCNGKIYTIGCGEQGQLGRVTLRSASGDSRRGKTELLTPGCVQIQRGKLCEKVWATNYCSFTKEFNSSKIYAFGLNNYCQLGMNRKIHVEARPTVTDIENVKTIAGGQQHTLILKNDKKCYAIGKCNYGRLGLGNIKEDVTKFEEITKLSDKNIEDICCGDTQSFAISNDGKIYAFGMGDNYQLGTGNDSDELEPLLIVSKSIQDKKIFKASSGGQHSLFLVEDEITNETIKKNETLETDKKNVTSNNNEKVTNSNLNDIEISNKEYNETKDIIAQTQSNKTKNENDDDVKMNGTEIKETVQESAVTTTNKRGRKRKH